MIHVDVRSLTQPVGIVRLMAATLTCVCFSLVASAGYVASPYWAWCMFTWCFCFFFTLLILILEFTTFSAKLPFAWDDFTTAFAMLASLMCLSACIIYPTFFACNVCYRQIGACAVAAVCLGFYTHTHRCDFGLLTSVITPCRFKAYIITCTTVCECLSHFGMNHT